MDCDAESRRRVGELLASCDVVIEAVVRHLVLADLQAAAQVSKAWHRAALKFKRDSSVRITVRGYEHVKSDHYFLRSETSKEEECSSALTLMDTGVYDRHWYFLRDKEGGVKELNKTPKYRHSAVHARLRASLSACDSLLLLRPSSFLRYHDPEGPSPQSLIGYITLTFPSIQGIRVTPFQVDSDEKSRVIERVGEVRDVKFLLLFPKSDKSHRHIEQLTSHCLSSPGSRELENAVFAVQPVTKTQDCLHEVEHLKGVVFSGERLHVTTHLLKEGVGDLREQGTHLGGLSRRNSLALVFYRRSTRIDEVMAGVRGQCPRTLAVGVQCEGLARVEVGEGGVCKVQEEQEGVWAKIILLSWY